MSEKIGILCKVDFFCKTVTGNIISGNVFKPEFLIENGMSP